jgi:type I restriction enzyme S subunit
MIPAAPRLRFPEFKDPWKPGHAGDAFKNSRAKGAAGLPIYSVTMDRGLVRRDSIDRHMAADAADGQNLRAQRGDVVYNMMRMWQGAVGLAPEECMVSPAYVVLSPKKHTSPQFFDQWFKGKRMLYLLGAYSHGITSDRLRLYADDFARIPVHLPSLPEQQKIAAFLGVVDAKLAALATKQAALGRFKAGLMQKLFRQQLRFTQDDGAAFPNWEEERLGDVFTWVKTNSLSREFLTYDGGLVQNIHYGDIHTKFRALFRQSAENVPFIAPNSGLKTLSEEEYCQIGDVVIADASEDFADIGKAIEIVELSERSLVAGLHTYIARPKIGSLVLGFSGYLLRSEPMRRQIVRIAQGISVLGISKGNLEKLTFWLPHPDEQQKIADALAAMDAKIQAVADQIVKLQIFKKGLLRQMFA